MGGKGAYGRAEITRCGKSYGALKGDIQQGLGHSAGVVPRRCDQFVSSANWGNRVSGERPTRYNAEEAGAYGWVGTASSGG